MSKHTEKFLTPLQADQMMMIIQDAIASLNLLVFETGPNFITCKETAVQSTSFTWPAEIRVELFKHQKGTAIILYGNIFGIGPLQSNHLKGQMGNLKNRILLSTKKFINKMSLEQNQHREDKTSFVNELERLGELLNNGVITQEEFLHAKKKLLND